MTVACPGKPVVSREPCMGHPRRAKPGCGKGLCPLDAPEARRRKAAGEGDREADSRRKAKAYWRNLLHGVGFNHAACPGKPVFSREPCTGHPRRAKPGCGKGLCRLGRAWGAPPQSGGEGDREADSRRQAKAYWGSPPWCRLRRCRLSRKTCVFPGTLHGTSSPGKPGCGKGLCPLDALGAPPQSGGQGDRAADADERRKLTGRSPPW